MSCNLLAIMLQQIQRKNPESQSKGLFFMDDVNVKGSREVNVVGEMEWDILVLWGYSGEVK